MIKGSKSDQLLYAEAEKIAERAANRAQRKKSKLVATPTPTVQKPSKKIAKRVQKPTKTKEVAAAKRTKKLTKKKDNENVSTNGSAALMAKVVDAQLLISKFMTAQQDQILNQQKCYEAIQASNEDIQRRQLRLLTTLASQPQQHTHHDDPLPANESNCTRNDEEPADETEDTVLVKWSIYCDFINVNLAKKMKELVARNSTPSSFTIVVPLIPTEVIQRRLSFMKFSKTFRNQMTHLHSQIEMDDIPKLYSALGLDLKLLEQKKFFDNSNEVLMRSEVNRIDVRIKVELNEFHLQFHVFNYNMDGQRIV